MGLWLPMSRLIRMLLAWIVITGLLYVTHIFLDQDAVVWVRGSDVACLAWFRMCLLSGIHDCSRIDCIVYATLLLSYVWRQDMKAVIQLRRGCLLS